jgi:hypothetical protein
MTHESLVNGDWKHVIGRLGGPASLELSARETDGIPARSLN